LKRFPAAQVQAVNCSEGSYAKVGENYLELIAHGGRKAVNQSDVQRAVERAPGKAFEPVEFRAGCEAADLDVEYAVGGLGVVSDYRDYAQRRTGTELPAS
jgi:hypothetical protein